MAYTSKQSLGVIVLLVFIIFYKPVLAKKNKILIAQMAGFSSHALFSLELAKTLSARGNEVWVVDSEETYNWRIKGQNLSEIQFVLFQSTIPYLEVKQIISRYVATQLGSSSANSVLQYQVESEDTELNRRLPDGRTRDIFHLASYDLDDMISNPEVITKLKAVGFDMIVGDTVPLYQVFLSQVLNVPYIQFGLTPIAPSQHDRFAYSPSNAAYVPERMSFLTDTMTFKERVKNTLLYWITSFFYEKYFLGPLDDVLKKHNIRPDANFGQLMSEAQMWIFNSDFVVDFPRPLSPHVKFVGGVLSGPASPLDEEWQAFVDSSGEHGVVLLALGTLVSEGLTDEQSTTIAASLSLLPQKVVWGYSGKIPTNVGNNTKIVRWIPQNDLLGSPKVRAFISHGGLSSIHQCIYHAVPMVGIPVFGDQKDNFIRLDAKGMSLHLDLRTMTDRTLYDAINQVIYNRTFKENAERLSEIARDRPTSLSPAEETAYWIEYAIKHGTEHLKPYALQLSFIQYYLLDVIAFHVVIVIVICWLVRRKCSASRRLVK
ncbi:UDP-glucuronosyltransferase 2C1-like isoform X2 [Asterias rubens]|uniref:UDP-glucuronosyltransferase 2C1-like isoform X2 n=1 Tax=Asterias rubens TaxID=7604 RepID=UPI001455D010|nr:UDP-glucuronosyltransferase 2C1-like isoform X2 [Asterias rubens]